MVYPSGHIFPSQALTRGGDAAGIGTPAADSAPGAAALAVKVSLDVLGAAAGSGDKCTDSGATGTPNAADGRAANALELEADCAASSGGATSSDTSEASSGSPANCNCSCAAAPARAVSAVVAVAVVPARG